MEDKVIVKVLRRAYDIVLALLALAALIVLVSDVCDSLTLWKVCLIKVTAFAVLLAVFYQTPWFQKGLGELR